MRCSHLATSAVVVAVAACASESPAPPTGELVVEHQWVPLAQARDPAWTTGDLLLPIDATTTFPMSLSLRVWVGDDGAVFRIEQWLDEPFDVVVWPWCRLEYLDGGRALCTAELRVAASASSVIAMHVFGPTKTFNTCVAYALVDANTDLDALRADLDARRTACIDAWNP